MSEKTIGQILHRIQKELKAPKANKNTFGNYSYRSAEDILEAVKKCLQKDEYLTISDEIQFIGDRYYVAATVTLRYLDDYADAVAYAREEETKKGMDAAQITGSASSYARKYALNGLFCIDDTKDADATNDHGRGEPEEKFTKEQKSLQSVLFTELGKCLDEGSVTSFIDQYGKQIESLPKEMAGPIHDGIESRLEAIKNKVPLKATESHGFAGVEDAIQWMTKMRPVIDGFKSLKVMDMWEENNRPYINGLACLSAKKYEKDGKSPKERFLDALMQKRVELEATQTPIG